MYTQQPLELWVAQLHDMDILRPKLHSNEYLQIYLPLYHSLSGKGCGVSIHCHISPIQGPYLGSPILSFSTS